MQSHLNRRNWIKSSLLSAGAMAVGSQFGFESAKASPLYDPNTNRLIYSPLMEEFVPPKFPDLSTLKARLCWNENPFGPSPSALAAFQKAATSGNYYSWNKLFELVEKIAVKEGVEPKNIMMGPGSSDLLEKTGLVLFMNGGNIISADPSYMSLVNVAKAMGAESKTVKLTDDYQHDLKKMAAEIDENTKMVYITNPNNPTGTVTNADDMYKYCAEISERVPVFIDEAYLELSDDGLASSMVRLVKEGKNVIVSRTFSKIHGMAGMRVGYIVAKEEMLKKVQKITRGGMGLTGASIAAASASIDDTEFLDKSKSSIAGSRKFTKELLDGLGYKYMPSQTNFIIFPISMQGDKFLEQVYAKKVAVRAFKFWDQQWIRVSMGTPEEMKIFSTVFQEIVG